ncbi:hydrolase [Clostridium sp. CCUG 7971]|uniref:5' nucleotidase, NT5C type n=1 Tax=Clostridium sp. CCUG 7971 TaxID=2811414 RepID=UPI001ABB7FFE|nr:hydrolase [Clostridium sp. CCUG 7971]MBO3444433.1 hydrolase [Clostridium sp. CCUG 7971]
MNKLNICVDIDGTITSPYHFIPYLNELYNKNITEEQCNTCDWETLYEIKMDRMLSEFHEKYMHSYGEASVVEGAKEIIEELCSENTVYFVTARSESLTEITKKWLEDSGFSGIEVHLLGSDYKVEKAKALNCNVFIEDNPYNAIQLADEGIKVLLIDTNYNKGVVHENITRVNNWIEIKEFIDSYK